MKQLYFINDRKEQYKCIYGWVIVKQLYRKK